MHQVYITTDDLFFKTGLERECYDIRSKGNKDRNQLDQALIEDANGQAIEARAKKVKVQEILADLTGIVADILEPKWDLGLDTKTSEPPIEDRWRQRAALFIASRIADYSRHLLAQIRNMMGFTIAAAVAILIAISSYPFPASDTLLRMAWMLLMVAVIVGVWIAVQIRRDQTLSLLSGSTPGKIDWDAAFVGDLALYAVLPLLAILGIQPRARRMGLYSQSLPSCRALAIKRGSILMTV